MTIYEVITKSLTPTTAARNAYEDHKTKRGLIGALPWMEDAMIEESVADHRTYLAAEVEKAGEDLPAICGILRDHIEDQERMLRADIGRVLVGSYAEKIHMRARLKVIEELTRLKQRVMERIPMDEHMEAPAPA